ncbi:MAG: methyltransferase domain-containing protein [Candidatus Micrarchaeota archaeon]|nr:methyltransferase domain-containing protein [Candidatus Micrarchaeota archaeon]
MNEPEPTKKKLRAKTYLEIGAGEKAAMHLMPKIRRGDKYVTIDMMPLDSSNRAKVNVRGVKNLSMSADALSIPLRNNSVDHVISRNMLSDPGFPNIYASDKFRDLSFRQALEKIEAELHRVTRKGASITFHEHYTPEVFELPLEKSRRRHVLEVFGRRWIIGRDDFSKLPGERKGEVIKLFKK